MFSFSFNSILVFSTVVKSNSFSKAAKKLFITQPAVSNHIKELENQIGLKLIERGKNGITLTREGRLIYKYAEKMEGIAMELEKSIKSMRKELRFFLRIATTPVYSRVIVPSILSEFVRNYPEISIKIDLLNSEDMIKKILSAEIDVAIVANPSLSKKISSIPLIKEELVLIAPLAHPLAKCEAVSLLDVAPYPLILREEGSATRKTVLSAFSAMKISPSILLEVKSTEFIKEWVIQGRGLSILIRRAIQGEEERYLKVIPLKEKLYLEVCLIFLKSSKFNYAIQRFIEHIRYLQSQSLICPKI